MPEARADTGTLSPRLTRPSSIASSVSRMVITFVTLATGLRSSAFFSKMTLPVFGSVRMTLGLVRVKGVPSSIGASPSASRGISRASASAAAANTFFIEIPPSMEYSGSAASNPVMWPSAARSPPATGPDAARG